MSLDTDQLVFLNSWIYSHLEQICFRSVVLDNQSFNSATDIKASYVQAQSVISAKKY